MGAVGGQHVSGWGHKSAKRWQNAVTASPASYSNEFLIELLKIISV